MSYFAIAGAVIAVGSAAYQASTAGKASAKQADATSYQGALSVAMGEVDAERVESDTAAQVRQIKKQTIMVRGSQMAQQAASGVVVGDGSAGQMLDQTEKLATEDALAVMYSGANKAVSIRNGAQMQSDADQRQAQILMDKSGAEKTAANLNLLSSTVSAAGTSYNAFKAKT